MAQQIFDYQASCAFALCIQRGKNYNYYVPKYLNLYSIPYFEKDLVHVSFILITIFAYKSIFWRITKF